MILKLSLLLVLLLVVYSCTDKYPHDTSTQPKPSLIGSWEWQKTEQEDWSGLDVIIPDSVGYTEIWIFEKDNLFQLYRNDTLRLTSYYRITENEHSIPKISIGDWIPATFDVNEDVFIYSTAFVDGPTSYFVRKK
jgi:hypothetical protein